MKYTSLNRIILKGCEIGKQDYKGVRKVLMEGITNLDISYNKIGEFLPEIFNNLKLEQLDLSGCQIGDKGVETICPMLEHLQVLILRDNGLNESHCKIVARFLCSAKNLTKFDISLNFIKDEGACWIISSTA